MCSVTRGKRICHLQDAVDRCAGQRSTPVISLSGAFQHIFLVALKDKAQLPNILRKSGTARAKEITPPTFAITQSREECRQFFAQPDVRSTPWIIKPTAGSKGHGIKRVTNFDRELLEVYGACDRSTRWAATDQVVVQRIVKIHTTADGHAFDLRTHLALRLPQSAEDSTWRAFHIFGYMRVCAIPLRLQSDPALRRLATVCNYDVSTKSAPFKNGKIGYNDILKPYSRPKSIHMSTAKHRRFMAELDRRLGILAQALVALFHRKAAKDPMLYGHQQLRWIILGADFLVEAGTLVPWLIEANNCPGSDEAPRWGDPWDHVVELLLTDQLEAVFPHGGSRRGHASVAGCAAQSHRFLSALR